MYMYIKHLCNWFYCSLFYFLKHYNRGTVTLVSDYLSSLDKCFICFPIGLWLKFSRPRTDWKACWVNLTKSCHLIIENPNIQFSHFKYTILIFKCFIIPSSIYFVLLLIQNVHLVWYLTFIISINISAKCKVNRKFETNFNNLKLVLDNLSPKICYYC